MALTKCTECNREISTNAAACPGCGAPRVSAKKESTAVPTWLTFLIFAGLFLLLVRGCSSTSETPAIKEPTKPVVDYSLPLETEHGTLVCPIAALFDQREGRGIKAAMASRLSVFSRLKEAEAAGCTEWREGIPIEISKEESERASKGQQEKICRMLEFSGGLVFSCQLRNSSGAKSISIAPPLAPELPSSENRPMAPTVQEPREIIEPPRLETVPPAAAASSEGAASEASN